MLGETPGVVVAALSYPFAGSPRPDALTFLRDIPRIRGAFLDTPPAVMLALDYLLKRSDVDTTRVGAIGVSLARHSSASPGRSTPASHGYGRCTAPVAHTPSGQTCGGPSRSVHCVPSRRRWPIIINGPARPVRWVSHARGRSSW